MTWQPTETDITSRVAFDLAEQSGSVFLDNISLNEGSQCRSGLAASIASLTDDFDSVPTWSRATDRAQALRDCPSRATSSST